MKKRIYTLLLALLMLGDALVISSCSDSTPASDSNAQTETTEFSETTDETADSAKEDESETEIIMPKEELPLTEGQIAINTAIENIKALGIDYTGDFSLWREDNCEYVISEMKAIYESNSDVYKMVTFLPDARNIYLNVYGTGVRYVDLFPESDYSGYIMNEDYISILSESIEAYNDEYYHRGQYPKADFWDYAEIFEMIEDAYETTGDEKYLDQINEMGKAAIKFRKKDWSYNDFNDDIMWLVIAFTRAYNYTGNTEFLEVAEWNFNMAYDRAADDKLGGGLYWKTDNKSKNVCVNCPAAVAAGYLAKATGNNEYYDKLKFCLDWVVSNMYESSGKVYDSYTVKTKEINKWSSTYNQGTFIGSCLMWYEHTGDSEYLTYAQKAASYCKKNMYSNKVMDNEESGNDLPGFKGILARYIRMYFEFTGNSDYMDWLRLNADTAYSNRNSKGLMNTQFNHKTRETSYDVFTMSSAVSAIANSVGVKVK